MDNFCYDVVINMMGIPLLRREGEIINAFEHENTAVNVCRELNRLAGLKNEAEAKLEEARADEGARIVMKMKFSRHFSMPTPWTFEMKPVREFLARVLHGRELIVDPFAGRSKWANISNDLDPSSNAKMKMEATEFCNHLRMAYPLPFADAILFDPPYSPRQISECYAKAGLTTTMKTTQSGGLYKAVKDSLSAALKPNGIAVSFGWNSQGFGKNRGFEIVEIMLVHHGGAHNDTIVVVERKLDNPWLFEASE